MLTQHAALGTVTREAPARPFDTPIAGVPYPVALQIHAQESERKHATRAIVRRLTLVCADVMALSLLRYVLRAVRDMGMFGDDLRNAMQALMPKGSFYPYEVVAAILLGLTMTGSYSGGSRRTALSPLFYGVLVGFALISWGRFWAPLSLNQAGIEHAAQSLLSFAFGLAVLTSAIMTERQVVDYFVRRLRPLTAGTNRVLAVGPAKACRETIATFVDGERAFTGVGAFTTNAAFDPSLPDDRDALVRAIGQRRADAVVICGDMPPVVAGEVIRLADAAGCQVLATSRLKRVSAMSPARIWVNGLPLIQLTRPGPRTGQLVLKRVYDVALAAVGLVLLSPLLLAVALLVRLSSRGPILFRQARVGRAGARFLILKFRTMVGDAESRRADLASANVYADARLFKVANDPRVTRLGRILRATSLDELPQLWNVLCGDMSLVGPRPAMESELTMYREHDYARFDMRPGITGPWQVSGRNNVTDFDQVVRLETEYMREWGFASDVTILLKTVPVVLSRAGAV